MGLGKKLITMLNRIIPKKDIVLMTSFPPFKDNSLALYQYIIDNRKDLTQKYEFVWSQDEVPEEIREYYIGRGKYVQKNSLIGLWFFLRARYVISTHDYFSDVHPGKGQYQINLWHGNGYKVIPPKDRAYRGDYTISTAEIYVPIISEKLSISPQNVWITGLPRNDALFSKTGEMLKIIQHKTYKKIFFWMPTYRKARFNHEGIDGNIELFGLSSFISNDFYEFDRFLKEHDILLLIKPHPMDEWEKAKIASSDNIIFITNQTLEEYHINLYSLLAETDALISDYSSVVIDYLLTDKPIGIVCADLEEYKSNRGFVLNPVVDYLPGPMITTSEQLKDFILAVDEVDNKWRSKRLQLKQLFHKYQDQDSAKRVCDLIFSLSNQH